MSHSVIVRVLAALWLMARSVLGHDVRTPDALQALAAADPRIYEAWVDGPSNYLIPPVEREELKHLHRTFLKHSTNAAKKGCKLVEPLAKKFKHGSTTELRNPIDDSTPRSDAETQKKRDDAAVKGKMQPSMQQTSQQQQPPRESRQVPQTG